MPRPQSDIWQYFTVHEGPEGQGRKARCSFCGHQQACGITRLHQHLLRKCPRIPIDLRNNLQQREDARGRVVVSAATMANLTAVQRQALERSDRSASATAAAAAAAAAHDIGYSMEIDRALSTLAAHGISPLQPTPYDALPASNLLQQQQARSPFRFDAPSPTLQYAPANSNSAILATTTAAPPGSMTTNTSSQQARTQSMLDWHLARALFSANIPFTVVDNPHMAEFLRRMRPGYVVPRPQRLQQYLLKEQHWDLIPMNDDNAPSPFPSADTQQQQQFTTPVDNTNTSDRPIAETNGTSNNNNNPVQPSSSSSLTSPATVSSSSSSSVNTIPASSSNNDTESGTAIATTTTTSQCRQTAITRASDMDGSL